MGSLERAEHFLLERESRGISQVIRFRRRWDSAGNTERACWWTAYGRRAWRPVPTQFPGALCAWDELRDRSCGVTIGFRRLSCQGKPDVRERSRSDGYRERVAECGRG